MPDTARAFTGPDLSLSFARLRGRMHAILVILVLIGSLGVFLLGMKLMSEGLQKVAGERLRTLVARITSNRVSGVLTGVGVTAVVQSSSATTVMVVSFVTAGLLTLTQAIGVIMGANIGTTVTGWLVALIGFKVKINAFALPAVGIGLFLTFINRSTTKQWGEVLIGFGVLFLGLGLLKDSVPAISDPKTLAWIAGMTAHGWLSMLFFVGFGSALTVVLQSSSATMTLTLTFAALGWLPYDMAAAMVLGENIGTTATANLAAIGAPHEARRAARAHFVFNVVGATWAMLLMKVGLLPLVDLLVPGNPDIDFNAIAADDAAVVTARVVVTTHLAAFHTTFNLINTLLMLPFVRQLAALVSRWVPEDPAKVKPKKDVARYLSGVLVETPELLLVQVGQEMQHMTDVVRKMFADALHILTHPTDKLATMVADTLESEEVIDALESEITTYLSMTARSATTVATARRIAGMVQNAHRLERIGDHCAVLVRIAKRVHEDPEATLTERDLENIKTLGALVDQALENLGKYLAGKPVIEGAEQIEDAIDRMRRQMRQEEIQRMRDAGETLGAGLAFLDVITHFEEIGDRTVGIIRLAELSRRAL